MSRKRPKREQEEEGNGDGEISPFQLPTVYASSKIQEADSYFMAHFISLASVVTNAAPMVAHIRSLPNVAGASHHIAAWKTAGESGHDDDGERWAGSKVERVLAEASNVTYGVLVVSRWFGGTMLGPKRFDRMQHVAQEAIEKFKQKRAEFFAKRTLARATSSSSSISLTNLTGEEGKEKACRMLRSKDMTISFLRDKIHASPQKPPISPQKAYETLPLDKLRNLVKAREATIRTLRDLASPKKDSPIRIGP